MEQAAWVEREVGMARAVETVAKEVAVGVLGSQWERPASAAEVAERRPPSTSATAG